MKKYLNTGGKLLDCSAPKVMGILNITPDSFYDGGKYQNENDLFSHAGKMIEEGASIIDIGAQSTRPGAAQIPPGEEWNRLAKPLRQLRNLFPDIVISVDTFYSSIAEQAVAEGADMINDISGGTMDSRMFEMVAGLKVPYVLMHIQGTPQTMQEKPAYKNVVNEVMNYFASRVHTLVSHGVTDIILDPGFGFGKTLEHNFELLADLELFKALGRPLLAGFSRKSMVNKVIRTKPEDSLNGTTVLNTIALQKGISILRVHDVKEAVEAIRLTSKVSPLYDGNSDH